MSALHWHSRPDGVAVISIADDPLNRMTLAFVSELEEAVAAIAADGAVLDSLHDAEHKTLEKLLASERAGVHATLGSPDAAEGMLAFMEKRRPVFNQPSD